MAKETIVVRKVPEGTLRPETVMKAVRRNRKDLYRDPRVLKRFFNNGRAMTLFLRDLLKKDDKAA